MKKFGFAIGSAALLAMGVALAAPAAAVPVVPSTAQETIDRLQSEGYRVILSRVGSGPTDGCAVTAVRPGRDISELQARPRGNTETVVLYTTVYVDLACGR